MVKRVKINKTVDNYFLSTGVGLTGVPLPIGSQQSLEWNTKKAPCPNGQRAFYKEYLREVAYYLVASELPDNYTWSSFGWKEVIMSFA
jgi:hypothetical protein